MINLELDEEEVGLLQQILEDYLSDLRVEIIDTDSYEYKEMLKNKKLLLLKMQTSLNHASLEPLRT